VRLAALTRKIMGCEEWLLLVDLALANRPLDPAVPRLLRRDPERLLDRLRLLLTSSAGSNALPAMSRLVRAVGEPVFGRARNTPARAPPPACGHGYQAFIGRGSRPAHCVSAASLFKLGLELARPGRH